ncbi:MAG: hypothetical protein U9532_02645 ['Conium maculatum' witches'-broom phytoplasma]|nr:hypothetical protein ['Conium maculatum' witches'-broom phytoplasma]
MPSFLGSDISPEMRYIEKHSDEDPEDKSESSLTNKEIIYYRYYPSDKSYKTVKKEYFYGAETFYPYP